MTYNIGETSGGICPASGRVLYPYFVLTDDKEEVEDYICPVTVTELVMCVCVCVCVYVCVCVCVCVLTL